MFKKIKLSHLEIPLAILAFFAGWYILGHYALGGPNSNDNIAYMNAGLNHVADTYILNRYFHVYLMTLFLKLAPSPLVGFQYFWAFLMAATAFLVYYNARTFTGRSNFIHGLLSVGIFFSFQFFALNAGWAGVDMTTMFMFMVIITVYLVSVRLDHKSKWLLTSLGILFFLAFKTKETAVVTGLLVFGVGVEEGHFRFKLFLNRMLYVMAGVLGGILFFAILNWFMLGDPLFGLRISNIRDFLSGYVTNTTGQSQSQAESGNWYTAFLMGAAYIPFVLFLISGVKASPDLDLGRKLVWWVPLVLVCLVSLTTSISWGPRFLLPAVPIISMLGPQFLDLAIPNGKSERIKMGIVSAAALGGLLILRLAMYLLYSQLHLNASLLYVTIYEPAVLSVILAISFLWNRFSPNLSVIAGVIIIALIVTPIISNAKSMVKAQNLALSNTIFYPYSAFSGEIHYSAGMQMFVSLDAWKTLGVPQYCKTIDGVVDLFNIYFDSSIKRSNFTVPTDPAAFDGDVTRTSYAYILMSKKDWRAIPEATRSTLLRRYTVLQDEKGLLVFLELK